MDRVEKILVFVVVATIVVIVTLALSNSGNDLVEELKTEMRAKGPDTVDAQDHPTEVIDDDDGVIDLPQVMSDDSSSTTTSPAPAPANQIQPSEGTPKKDSSKSSPVASQGKVDVKADPMKTTEEAATKATAKVADKTASKPARPRWNDRYVVKKNDSFWNIAERIYGHGKYWDTIRKANLDVDPENLQPQTVLVLPKLDTSVKAVREPKLEMQGASRFRTVTLKKGEYLYLVLRREGLTSRYQEVLALNRLDEESAQLLREGFRIRIPRN